MGLGLNPKGSGISAAKFFAARGAKVIVTDLKTKKELMLSLKLLKGLLIRFVLGKHNESDFVNADLVIKNPGVRQTSKYLQIAKKNNVPIETDIGIFLKNCPAQVIGVTGTRGKSTTVALIGEMLKTKNFPSPTTVGVRLRRKSPFKKGGDGGGFNKGWKEQIFVGGNIQMSPLNFLNKVKSQSKIVLELSSWMLEDLFTPTCPAGGGAFSPYFADLSAEARPVRRSLGEGGRAKAEGETGGVFARGGSAFGGRGGPHIAVLTNLMPDHLNTYKNFGDYVKAKALIFKNQTKNDFAVLNYDDANVRKLAKEIKAKKIWFSKKQPSHSPPFSPGAKQGELEGVFVKKEDIIWKFQGQKEKIALLKNIKLLGEHNISNILAAVAVAKIEGAPNKAIKRVLKTFKGLPNRLEFVREVRGIKFYNDTTSTMPEATIAALRALSQIQKPPHSPPISPRAKQGEFPPDLPASLCEARRAGADQPLAEEGVKNRNIILIAGGSDKKLEYKELAKEIKKYCKAVVLFGGKVSEKILKVIKRWNLDVEVRCNCHSELVSESVIAPSQTLKQVQGDKKRSLLIIENVKSMKEAMRESLKLAKGGDIILLSPAAASFGLFQNEFDRGEQFVKEVRGLE